MHVSFRTLWEAIDQYRATIAVVVALSAVLLTTAFGVVVSWAVAPGLLRWVGLLLLGALIVCFVIVWARGDERRGTGIAKDMRAFASAPGKDREAKSALMQAAIANGFKVPPRLLVSERECVNAAIVGRPDTASWAIVVTRGFLALSPREQIHAYATLIARRPDRPLSWPLVNLFVCTVSAVVDICLAFYLIFTSPPDSLQSAMQAAFVPILLAYVALGVGYYVSLEIALLGDQWGLMRSKDPEAEVAGLTKADQIGTRVYGLENRWDYLFWFRPRGNYGRLNARRIAAAERVGGAASAGVRSRFAGRGAPTVEYSSGEFWGAVLRMWGVSRPPDSRRTAAVYRALASSVLTLLMFGGSFLWEHTIVELSLVCALVGVVCLMVALQSILALVAPRQ